MHHVVIWNDSYTFTIQHQNEYQVIFSFYQLFPKLQCNPYFSSNCEIQKSASINIIVTIVFFLICWTPYQYSLGQKVIKSQPSDSSIFKLRWWLIISHFVINLLQVSRKNADWKNGIPIVTLVYVNSALNPFLYSLFTNNFSKGFQKRFYSFIRHHERLWKIINFKKYILMFFD